MGTVISTHLPPPVMIDSTDVLRWVTHMLCWTWAMYFSAAASSENDHGSMNLASNTASVPSTMPSRVATIQEIAECLTRRWMSRMVRPVLRSYQERLSPSVAAVKRHPELAPGRHEELTPRVSGVKQAASERAIHSAVASERLAVVRAARSSFFSDFVSAAAGFCRSPLRRFSFKR